MRIAAVVLAAGRSARLAPRNKLLETIDGDPMIRRVATNAVASGANPVVVVTGFDGASVAAALRGLDLTVIANPCYSEGLSTSLRAGLSALSGEIEGALICLGDMPEVDASVHRALIAASTSARSICVPVRHGRRGNPVLWGRGYFAEIMQLSGDSGAKPLMAKHEPHLIEVDVATDAIFHDFDTAADFARRKQRNATR